MFSRFNIALIVVILGLCLWSWGQYQNVLDLRAKNQAQAQTIFAQEVVNKQLSAQLEEERLAIEVQQQVVNELRAKAESKREIIKSALSTEPCAHTAMPRTVIEQLQSKGNNKD